MPELEDTLRLMRKKYGYSQEQVADFLGVTRFTIANYESGRRKPSVRILKKLAALYKVSLDDITENDSADSIETLLALAQSVFSSSDISRVQKESVFQAIMRSYLSTQEDMNQKR